MCHTRKRIRSAVFSMYTIFIIMQYYLYYRTEKQISIIWNKKIKNQGRNLST